MAAANIPLERPDRVTAIGLDILLWVVVDKRAAARRAPSKRSKGCSGPDLEAEYRVGSHLHRMGQRATRWGDPELFDHVFGGPWKTDEERQGADPVSLFTYDVASAGALSCVDAAGDSGDVGGGGRWYVTGNAPDQLPRVARGLGYAYSRQNDQDGVPLRCWA